MAGFLVLLALIHSMMPTLRNFGLKLEAMEESRGTVAREPVVLPEDMLTLYRAGELHIFASLQDARNLNDSLTIYVQNDSPEDVTVQSSVLLVNNYVIQSGSLYCEAGDNAIGKTWLHLDEEELRKARIRDISSVSFRLEVYDPEYNLLFPTELITLGQTVEAFPEYDGDLLYEQEGLAVRYLDYCYSLYHPERFDKGSLEFCLENTSDDTLFVACEKAAVNGEEAGVLLWVELPPGTRTIAEGELYDYSNPDLRSPVNALVELSLEICRNNDLDSIVHTGPLRFPAAVALDQKEAANG